jgi:hypothetical protein
MTLDKRATIPRSEHIEGVSYVPQFHPSPSAEIEAALAVTG